jgi:hypothetical protein
VGRRRDDAALAAGTAPLPVAAVDEFLAIETQAAKEGVEPTARYEALRPGMPGVIAAARKIVDKGKRDGIPGHEGEDRGGRQGALGEDGANPAPMGHASAALRGTAATVAIRQRVVPGGLTEPTRLIVLERTNIHLRHSLREAEQERQRHLAERNAAVAERDAIRAEIEGVRESLAETTAERGGLVAAGTDVLDEGVERTDRFLEAARERVSVLVERLLDENERLARRLAAAEAVAAAQAEIAESLLDRIEGDVLEAIAAEPATTVSIALDHRRPLEAPFGNVVRTRVERTFAWFGRNRRLAKDFEATIASAVTMVYLASIQLLIRRLARA